MTIDCTTPPLDQASLKAAADATATWPIYCGYCSAVYYNLETGKVWTRDESDSSITRFGSSVICVLRTTKKVSVQRVQAAIKESLEIEREAQAILAERGETT